MKKLVLLAVLLPVLGVAANICVWNYDPVDRFYDPARSDSVDCAYYVAQTLMAQGHAVQVSDIYLPTDISNYDLVFCLLGWPRC